MCTNVRSYHPAIIDKREGGSAQMIPSDADILEYKSQVGGAQWVPQSRVPGATLASGGARPGYEASAPPPLPPFGVVIGMR